jgi:hypothetical protein
MPLQPQTTGNDIRTRLNNVLMHGILVPKDDPQLAGIENEISQLYKADHDAANGAYALLCQVTGDLDQALSYLSKTKAPDPLDELILLSNYGRCRAAQVLYAKHGSPRGSMFSAMFYCGFVSGSFHMLAQFTREAMGMKLTNLDKVPADKIFDVERLLVAMQLTDEVTAEFMEIAASLLLESGLLFIGNSPEINVLDVPDEVNTIEVNYRIHATPAKAVALYSQFVDRLIGLDRDLPRGLHITFTGTEVWQ